MENTYHYHPSQHLMYKRVSPTEVILVQVLGRDLGKPFIHRHEKVTYPSKQRLDEVLDPLEAATIEEWESIMNEYLAVNKEKLAIMSNYRQHQYNRGLLKL